MAVILVIGVLMVGAWFLFKAVFASDMKIYVTLALGAGGWLIKSHYERKRDFERQLAREKREHYIELMDIFNNAAAENREDNSTIISEREARRWNLRLAMIGSDPVIKAWIEARKAGMSPGASSRPKTTAELGYMFRKWTAFLLEMRKDAGHIETKLDSMDLLRLLLHDAEFPEDDTVPMGDQETESQAA